MRLRRHAVLAAALVARAAAGAIRIEYPPDGAVFPPEITAPTVLWEDLERPAGPWFVEVSFPDGSPCLRFAVPVGPSQWRPGQHSWDAIKAGSLKSSATLTVKSGHSASSASVTIHTSRHPAGAPIFYREVPLAAQPLAPEAIPLISWRLRDLAQPRSRLVMQGARSCAGCHSFSRDGNTMGMHVDGERQTYAMAPVQQRIRITNAELLTWSSSALTQVSPDGRYAVTTVNEEIYAARFPDFRFRKVFYPTRGVLAVCNRATGEIRVLPGADDPGYVHTGAVWSPDGRSLVFSRAAARDAYPAGRPPAGFAGDPNETPIRYDLYRIPFEGGRGGRAEPIAGASANGMSNSFPRASPDGRWIVFVQSRNGQLLRPDSRLFLVPAAGGAAREMRCNTPLLNSWHSFSPNGRWMVFAGKARSPYTRMLLTHIDEDGNDTPPVLVEEAAADERAVNLPEFVNIGSEGLLRIEAPAAGLHR